MDPSETQSPPSSRLSAMVLSSSPSDPLAVMASNCSPSEQLSAMILNSSPAQQAPPDASRDAPRDAPTKAPSSRASLFGNGRPSRTPSPPGTPSPLDRRISNKLNRSPSRAHRVDALSDQTSGDFPYLAREPSLPYEAWENVFYAMLATYSYEEYDFTYGDVFEQPETKKTLSTLRLVNRIWNRIATPLLFRNIQAVVGYSAGRPLDSILRISESPYALYVRDVRFGFVGSWLPGLDYDRYIDDLAAGALPILISRFQNIQTLRLQTPTVIDTFSEEGQLKPAMLAKLTNALVHTLRLVSVPILKCLHISMPTTAEFARFFESNSYTGGFTNIFGQLEELHITINDSTGPDGRRDPKWPRSVIKTKYPPDRFAPYLIQLIAYARRIQVFSLDARTWFDVSDLEAESFTKLKSFRLEGVRINHKTLRQIFIEARDTLHRIQLVHVRLMSGTWQEVFDHSALPPKDLSWLYVHGCGYSMTGASARYMGSTFSRYPTALWTRYAPDWLAITHWRTVVNTNRQRRSLPICPYCYYPSIEPILRDLGSN
ncbi:hypothetical protein E8E15_000846 [Penicillium rubens]|uniref:Uncharacterized protein n=1 Tax=Penicillium chrysogenum TaxID=5076 RepID=A0A167PUJ3_PENCH|nr:uncharacterized protein N7525_011033 [Penicillium rubens]KZN83848.1 hypothetical protein EN45_109580 [Penicillium chrysogenum]KAF3012100.1 hypothetical protein E8E15_000846 [Penicillium rubens]KAJ5036687.1 hypothetical protein NUH16_004564 [Penicillium rubens]KAJ5821749.1 hypothetical protein N7525_011033 [Penicillium rubens]KAJ5859394.1 hypothetical protein N7534_004671 [Penicillium rubens]